MSGIAEVLVNLGYRVTGSDMKESSICQYLRDIGIGVVSHHSPENITPGIKVVVYSSAIGRNNVEFREAVKAGITLIPRAEMLAELMRMKYGIAIGGSHGKTTTTSMLAKVLSDGKLDPTTIVGGRILNRQSYAKLGTGEYLIAEADESDGSFSLLRPAISVITNIDCEHLGHYGSIEALESAFARFMGVVPFYGVSVVCADDDRLYRLSKQVNRRTKLYGLSERADIRAVEVEVRAGRTEYTLICAGQKHTRISLPIPGKHMACNSLAVVSIALELGIPLDRIARSLAEFPGVARRTEVIGERNGVLVIDDYAHHPTEISCTLEAVRKGWSSRFDKSSSGKLICLFQPHRYTRTRDLFEEFKGSFSSAHEIYISEVFAAGEEVEEEVSGALLAESINHPHVSYCGDFEGSLPDILNRLSPGDVVVTLGAGSISGLARQIHNKLNLNAGNETN